MGTTSAIHFRLRDENEAVSSWHPKKEKSFVDARDVVCFLSPYFMDDVPMNILKDRYDIVGMRMGTYNTAYYHIVASYWDIYAYIHLKSKPYALLEAPCFPQNMCPKSLYTQRYVIRWTSEQTG